MRNHFYCDLWLILILILREAIIHFLRLHKPYKIVAKRIYLNIHEEIGECDTQILKKKLLNIPGDFVMGAMQYLHEIELHLGYTQLRIAYWDAFVGNLNRTGEYWALYNAILSPYSLNVFHRIDVFKITKWLTTFNNSSPFCFRMLSYLQMIKR